jgi:hypothetical protein
VSNALSRLSGDSLDRTTSTPATFGWAAREAKRVRSNTELSVLRTQGRAIEAAATVRGAEYIGEEVMTSLDRLRRHEARAAADDPVVADEYAAVRRAVLYAGLNEIDRFGRAW